MAYEGGYTAAPQPPAPETLTCARSLKGRRVLVCLAVGKLERPPTWPDPAAPSAGPALAPATVSLQPAGQSRAGCTVPSSSQPSSHSWEEAPSMPGTLLRAQDGQKTSMAPAQRSPFPAI